MPSPLFEFFEIIAEELSIHDSKVITPDGLKTRGNGSSLLDDLKREVKANNSADAFKNSVQELRRHFEAKGAKLPFNYEPTTGMFVASDSEFLNFVNDMSRIRSAGERSRDFECRVAERLRLRATGTIHRVGHPRDNIKKKVEFNAHLQTLGFSQPVLLGKDKDGGFDILWLLPIGTLPHRPIVSVQCKNGKFDLDEADKSVAAGRRTFMQHGGLQPTVHVFCVLFNDYPCLQKMTTKQLEFVPLGLTDLATMEQSVSVEFL